MTTKIENIPFKMNESMPNSTEIFIARDFSSKHSQQLADIFKQIVPAQFSLDRKTV